MITADAAVRRAQNDKVELGFWLYLMTDVILFASLFATYMILKNNTAGGITTVDIMNSTYAFIETVVLLTSSFTCAVALLAVRFRKTRVAKNLLIATVGLGALFLSLEITEFATLIHEGVSWTDSAFLSAFFTLVGTHGLHISVGIIWGSLLVWLMHRDGITTNTAKKLTLFGLFWHFLDIIWIFLFAIVFLGGTR